MKRLSLLFSAVFAVCSLMARPAHRGQAQVTQPDGSLLTICLHGDEWQSFSTTSDGYTVVKDQQGYYVYAQLKDGMLKASSQMAHNAESRTQEEKAYLRNTQKHLKPEMVPQTVETKRLGRSRQQQTLADRRTSGYDYNNFRGLVILVEFTDMQFSRNDYHDLLNDMINKENYTGFDDQQYSGSVRDYFNDNSMGKFKPAFDVIGPFQINHSQYEGRMNTLDLINDALNIADGSVNYADYDGDNDGKVDLVFFVFAGYGSCFAGNDERLLWPHRSVIRNNGNLVKKDGVRFYDYACSVEMFGLKDYAVIDGIGTICHEFSHVLGLPDFYDTDYEENGQSITPDDWSLMAGGVDFNNGRTPIGYSLYERWSVGFADDPQEISAEGAYVLNPLSTSNTGYLMNTPVSNEYFLFESRHKNMFKWDQYLPGSGMLVHRVDKTNLWAWTNFQVNSNPEHNYYQVVKAMGDGNPTTNQGHTGSPYDVFPGRGKVKTLHSATSPANLKTWNGTNTPWALYNIAMSKGVVTFDVTAFVAPDPSDIRLQQGDSPSADVLYNLAGQRVANDYKGLVIKNGKKFVVK